MSGTALSCGDSLTPSQRSPVPSSGLTSPAATELQRYSPSQHGGLAGDDDDSGLHFDNACYNPERAASSQVSSRTGGGSVRARPDLAEPSPSVLRPVRTGRVMGYARWFDTPNMQIRLAISLSLTPHSSKRFAPQSKLQPRVLDMGSWSAKQVSQSVSSASGLVRASTLARVRRLAREYDAATGPGSWAQRPSLAAESSQYRPVCKPVMPAVGNLVRKTDAGAYGGAGPAAVTSASDDGSICSESSGPWSPPQASPDLDYSRLELAAPKFSHHDSAAVL